MKKKLVLICILMISLMLVSCGNENVLNASDEVNATNEILNVVENDTTEVSKDDDSSNEENQKDLFDGYLWEVKGENSTVYLFGSIYMAEKNLYPFTETVESAFDVSDHLVVEANVADLSDMMVWAEKMINTEGDLYDHLSDAGIEKYEAVCKDLNLKPELFSRFKVWVAGSNLLSLQLMKTLKLSIKSIMFYIEMMIRL